MAIDEGCSARLLQKTPHVVLLSRKFYHEKLMPLLAQWVLLWMRQRRLREVSDEVTLSTPQVVLNCFAVQHALKSCRLGRSYREQYCIVYW